MNKTQVSSADSLSVESIHPLKGKNVFSLCLSSFELHVYSIGLSLSSCQIPLNAFRGDAKG